MTEIVIQPDATAGLDTMIKSGDVATNYGTNALLQIGEWNGGVSAERALIKFDLSSIPTNAVFDTAVLSLYATGDLCDNARTIRVYRQLRVWVEAQATWNIYSTGNNWATAGGFGAADCEQTDIGSKALGAAETLNQFKDITLTAAKVEEMLDGTITNNGFLIKVDTETDDMYQYASSDNGTAGNRPKLTINYHIPCGSPMWFY